MAKRQDKQIITGLDIGTSKIVALIAEVGDDGIMNVIGMGKHPSRGLKRGVVVDIEATVNSIKRAIEEAELIANCEVTNVYAGIAGSHIRSFNSHGIVAIKDNEVTRADIDRVIEAAKAVAIPADQKILHVLPQEFIIDNQGSIREPIGMAGVRLEAKVHIVTGAVSAAQNIIKCVNLCGLEVRDIILEQLASSHAVLTDDEKELGVCLVDIGGGTTDIAVFSQGAIQHTAVIPIAGDQVTNDIAMALRTPTKSAEQIKIRYATTIPSQASANDMIEVSPASNECSERKISASTLAEVVYARYEELFMLVNNELSRSSFYDRIPAGLVLTGGGSCANGALSLAEMCFNMPVRHGLTNRIAGMADDGISPAMATGVGLLIHGFNHRQETGYTMQGLRPQAKNVWSKMRAWFQGNF